MRGEDEITAAARLLAPGGKAELALGVKRRRWVLGVLAFMMLCAALSGAVLAFTVAPSMDTAAREQQRRVQALDQIANSIADERRAQVTALLDGNATSLRSSADVSSRLVASSSSLAENIADSARDELLAVTNGAHNLDAAVLRSAELLASGNEKGAQTVMASDGASAAADLDTAISRLRAEVDREATDAAKHAGDVLRFLALALCIPIAPTGWVFFQLIRGVKQIRDISGQMFEVSREVSSSAAQLSAASEELAANSVEGAAAFAEAVATIEELARAADDIAESVDGVADQSHDMRSNIEMAGTDIEESSRRMLALADRVNEIGVILGLINEIADQTNLLALNAAIEAARAGEGGKGFAVVAEEVRRLAERSKSSSAQIASIIEGAQAETAATVLSMEKGAKQMQHAIAFMDTVADASAQGRLSAEQQRSATQQVVITFEQLTGNSKSVSATTHQIAASAVSLANLARELETTAANSAAGV
jgi:hypothetical protein